METSLCVESKTKLLNVINLFIKRNDEDTVKIQDEKWQFARYLQFLEKALKSSDFPLEIEILSPNADPPDFIVKSKSFSFGVEVTEAVIQHYRDENAAKLKDTSQNISYEVFRNGTIKILDKGDELIGDGWSGNAPEMQQAAILMKAIQKKTKKLHQMRKNHKCNEYHLVVIPNPIFLNYERPKVFKIMKFELAKTHDDLFDKIFIIDGSLKRMYRSIFCKSGNKYISKSIRRAFN